MVGVGGVIRGCQGEWIARFTKSIGICNANCAEEWAILEGLQLAWDLGLKKVILESDAREVITWIIDENFNFVSSIVMAIRELITRD